MLPVLPPVALAAQRTVRALTAAFAAIGEARLRPAPSPRGRARRLRETLAELVAIHDLRVTVVGAPIAAPAIYVANHVSYLDPIVIGARLAIAPIAKAQVEGWPVIGTGARALGVIFVERGDAHSGACALRRAMHVLESGTSILNFPEGTTTDGARLLPFRRGIFGLAQLMRIPVVPIALRYGTPELAWTGGDTFLPHYLRTAARAQPSVSIRFGAPITPASFPSASRLAAYAHIRVEQLLDDARPDEPATRVRVPAPRPHAVLPPAERGQQRA